MAVNAIDEPIKRLLFSEEPFFDESFIGYIMRLAELNEIPDIRWILTLVRPGKFFKYDFKYSFDFKISVSKLSQLTGVEEKTLKNLLYSGNVSQFLGSEENLDIFKILLRRDLICRENPKICPRCLGERNYCRKIWEISLVTTCPIHRCLLLDYCPNCRNRLDWKRSKISICRCEFDLRKAEIFHLKEIELKLAKYFYQQLSINTDLPEFSLAFPLKNVSFANLIKLILFVAEHFSPMYDPEGNYFFKYFSNNSLHAFLTSAINVFENWAGNYHIFIRDWHKWETKGYLGRKTVDLWDSQSCISTYEYETFNFILYEYFYGKQFAFLRRGFEDFIERLLAEEFLNEPLLFDKYR